MIRLPGPRSTRVAAVCVPVLYLLGCAGECPGQGLLGRVLEELQGRETDKGSLAAAEPALVTAAEVGSAIASIQAELDAAAYSDPGTVTSSHLQALGSEQDLWRRIRLDLQQLETLQSESAGVRTKLAATLQQKEEFRKHGPAKSPPYSFLTLDALIDQRYAQRQRQKSSETEVELARDKRDRQAQRLDTTRRRARLAQEAFARAKPHESTRLHDEEQRSLLEVRFAEVQLAVAQSELAYQELLSNLVDSEYEFLEFRIAQMQPETAFAQLDLEGGLKSLMARTERLQQLVQQSQTSAAATEERLHAARDAVTPGPTHEEYLRTLAILLRRINSHERFLHDELDRLSDEREVWTRRWHIANHTASSDDATKWRDYSKQARRNLDKEKRILTAKVNVVRTELAALESRSNGGNQAIQEYHDRQIGELRQLIKIHELELESIRGHRWSHSKLLNEMQSTSAIAAAAALVDTSWQRVAAIWHYELLQVEGSPITVKKLVIGLCLIIFGFWLSRVISWFMARSVLPRFGVHGNAVMPIRTIIFYVLFLTCTLFALRIVCVPLTAFTLVGGALAIGIGVGSQAIANNFISGLILLAERPVRVGDTIELDGAMGTVEKIGARSTRIRTIRNLEIIVPNSKLLENTLTNWTLNDNRIRASVSVGIAYGTPTAKAEELMMVAAREVSEILQFPAPQVYFMDFGDNALVFEIHYWIAISSAVDRRLIGSRLRFSIERLFRDAGIVVAYPQRDLHLDSSSPIQVQLSSADLASMEQRRRAA